MRYFPSVHSYTNQAAIPAAPTNNHSPTVRLPNVAAAPVDGAAVGVTALEVGKAALEVNELVLERMVVVLLPLAASL